LTVAADSLFSPVPALLLLPSPQSLFSVPFQTDICINQFHSHKN
jgi:hypothetical protein